MSLKFFATFSRTAVASFSLLAGFSAVAQMIDVNGNGMSDVWEWVYGATNLPPAADSDNDGVSNINEAQAGTDPLNASSLPQISPLIVSPTNAVISMAAQLGKLYQLQSITNLASTNWLTETSTVVRSGSTFAFPSPAGGAMKFYRVLISDVDTDGDGVNDWEEYKLGLDPSNAMSNATLDGNGIAMGDYQYVTNMMAQQNVITVTATDPVTMQPDPGHPATDLGVFTFNRGGFALNAITVNFANVGYALEGTDYVAIARSITLPVGTASKTLSVVPLANTNLQAPVFTQVKLLPGAKYSLGTASNATVLIYPSSTPGGTGLTGLYYTNSATVYSSANNFNPANLITNRIDPMIDFNWTNSLYVPNLSNGLYSVRWTGQVQPQYSETYFFVVNSDDGCKLWVNDQLIIDNWAAKGASDLTGTIALQADSHYDLKLEYLQTNGAAQAHLSWYSADQVKQIIPSNRLYPTNSSSSGAVSNGLPIITSALSAVGFAGQPFSFTVTAANTPQRFTATNLPPGLVFNITNGLVSGTPSLAGDYQVPLTASNAAGLSASIVDIVIYNTGGAVSIEVWTNAPGTNISDIPLGTLPNITGAFAGLDGITNFGDNYGERIRGYFIAPATTNYYFWAAGSDSVQLWISDDGEPVNKLLRCWVTPTNNPTASGQNGTSPHQWNLQAKQRSGWLALNAGQKYYFEVLHKAGIGTNDHWSVGWLLDPTGTNTAPAGVTPPYLVTRYFTPLAVNIPGTLYTANMLALPGAVSTAVGSATLRVSADGSQAVLNYSVNGIPGTHVDHIYSDPYLTYPTTLIFDIAAAHPQTDGSYLWKINPASPFSSADIQEALIEGKCSIVIQTPAYPAGEIGGHFTLASGAQSFTAPPDPPAWADDSATTNGAVRFLTQATFGASPADIALVQSIGYTNWINNQLSLPATHALGIVQTNKSPDPSNIFPSSDWFNTWWQNSVTAPDQLRQRVAFALSEIMVASESGTLQDHSDALAYYYDTLLDNSFGNFRTLLKSVSLTPAMGLYLNMQGNDKGSLTAGTHANENYAREINQLFSIGLNRLWPDGSLVLNSSGSLVPTYNQSTVSGFAQTFTGWNYFQTNGANGRLPTNTFSPAVNYTNPMTLFPLHHDLNAKLLLDNVTLPPAWGAQTNTLSTNLDNYGLQDFEQALDAIYNHPNVGPFVCRELIQRLVTSNPSRGYLYRVVQKFNDNGSGVRGDMAAVVRAILLDPEARDPNMIAVSSFGKQREPLLRITATARAFPSPPNLTGIYTESGSQTISITTPQPHRMNNNDTVDISFADTSGNPAPPSQSYGISWTGSNTFNVTCPNLATGSYTQNTNVITVNISSHGLSTGNAAYLVFTTGGAVNGLYLVTSVISSGSFTVSTPDGAVRSGNCLMPKITASGYVQSGTNITISCAGPHGLVTNETLYIVFSAGSPTPAIGQYQVKGIPDATHFTVVATNSAGQTISGSSIYPLGPPALTRSGNATMQWSTWNMGYTDNGTTYNLAQSPLSPNTVFNFFFPAYEFPGALSAAGLTTPEFQLTSDTSVALQMNFLESGLFNNSNNTNGLSSFTANDGDIVLDIGPWMTTNYTSAAGIPGLVDNLNSVLLAGQLNNAARTDIINYVTNTANFTYGTPPTQAQIRDRVNAVVHLLICSPDFTIQK
ncbi:MAG TPA: DUF1800 family protein [Candidatus Acidoferrales bacterium]|jgi:hypothetical protein|nr:DUF1800 family protein [Candidatus Acidoferrales bacterium]